MKYDKIDGLDKNISKLIMGNDNQIYFDEAAKLWDHWVEVGGNAFARCLNLCSYAWPRAPLPPLVGSVSDD